MSPRFRWSTAAALISGLTLLALTGCEETSSRGDGGTGDDLWIGKCSVDKSVDFDTAIELKAGEENKQTGYLCPRTDKDFYRISVPAGAKLLRIKLQYVSTAPRVNLIYTLFGADQKPVERSGPGLSNMFDSLHCLDKAGTDYYIMVQDEGDDQYDDKISYTLSFSTEQDQDANEPNDTPAQATPLSGAATGYISCQGDQDAYKLQVGADQLVKINLAAASPTTVDLAYSIVDGGGNVVAKGAIPDGTKPDAKLEVVHAVPKAGAYTVLVSDDGDNESDAKVSYTLTASTLAEQDSQDKGQRNDTPAAATVVGTGGSGTLDKSFTGQIGSKGDVDYFVVNGLSGVSANNPAVMEVILQTPAGQVPIDPSFSIVYADSATSCTKDSCCTVLAGQSCKDNSECIRSSYTCINKGDNYCLDATCSPGATAGCATERACSGAAVCLPSKKCGAEHTFRSARNRTEASTVLTSQLLIHPGPWYVRVGDQQDDEYEHGRNYTVKIRVRMDPDGAKELDNELFGNRCFLVENQGIDEDQLNEDQAKTKLSGKKFNLGEWVQGYISYEGDIDYYTFDNPCPDANCTLSIDYEAGPGCPSSGSPLRYCQNPGDVKNYRGLEFRYYFGTSIGNGWSGFAAKAGESGTWGADGSSPVCCYSYSKHGSKSYIFTVEDMGQNFWSWSCYYRFRVRKVADGCGSPCVMYPSGDCGK